VNNNLIVCVYWSADKAQNLKLYFSFYTDNIFIIVNPFMWVLFWRYFFAVFWSCAIKLNLNNYIIRQEFSCRDWSCTRINSRVISMQLYQDKKTCLRKALLHKSYWEFYYTYTLLSSFSLFSNDPLEFEHYFLFYLSVKAKCPFQFTFCRHIFTVDKVICGIFS